MIKETLTEQITRKANKMQRDNPTLRWGQALFNTLYYTNEELANTIQGTVADCFYDDKLVGNFFNALYMYDIGQEDAFKECCKNYES